MKYTINIWHNGQFVCAKEGNLSTSASGGLFNQYKQQYTTRVWRGYKLVAAYTRPEDVDNMCNAGYIPCDNFDKLNNV